MGSFYQATHWIYLGSATQPYLKVLGQTVHPRALYDRYGRGCQSLARMQKNVDPQAQRALRTEPCDKLE